MQKKVLKTYIQIEIIYKIILMKLRFLIRFTFFTQYFHFGHLIHETNNTKIKSSINDIMTLIVKLEWNIKNKTTNIIINYEVLSCPLSILKSFKMKINSFIVTSNLNEYKYIFWSINLTFMSTHSHFEHTIMSLKYMGAIYYNVE